MINFQWIEKFTLPNKDSFCILSLNNPFLLRKQQKALTLNKINIHNPSLYGPMKVLSNYTINCRKLFIQTTSQVKKILICLISLNLLVTLPTRGIPVFCKNFQKLFCDPFVRHDSRIWAANLAKIYETNFSFSV